MEATEHEAIALWLKPQGSVVFVAEKAGEVVAAMMTKPMRYGNGDHIASFDLMVHRERRRRGIGRAVSPYVIEAARQAGYAGMEAFAVVETNVAAVRLWHSLGFRTIATVPAAFRHPTHGLVAVYHMYRSL
ncbi:GNAT family N-acetyltransferase [Paraburkholderia lacunae]|nr:GNAT family N-acetyltransferase [Paraburkholderia lacunae]